MNIGTPYKRAQLADAYDTIVIGSGMGGLTVASLLARHASQRVLVLERHYTAGGFTHSFARPGWDWDVGVHYVGDVHEGAPFRRIFDHLSEGQLDWADMGEVYDRIVLGDFRFDLVRGVKPLEAALTAAFPHEARGIVRYLDLVQRMAKWSQRYFVDRVLPRPLAAVLGPVLRYPASQYVRRTTASVVNELVTDDTLRALLTAQWGDYGLPPTQSSFLIHASVVNHYLRGAAYPVGGASRIAQTMLPSIERAGGAVVTRAEVARVVLERGRAVGVELADGRMLRARRVVSDAGVAVTFGKLLPAQARPRGFEDAATIPPSVAHVSLYVGFTRSTEALDLPKHNVWLFRSRDHDASFVRAQHAEGPLPIPGAFLSFGSARDPDFARRHPGHATAEVIALVPYRWFAAYRDTSWQRRGEAYEAMKAELTQELRAVLVSELPQVEGAIGHLELSTPLSTEHFAGHPSGEIYGLAHTPARFAASWLRPQTDIPGLYLTGADVCTAGVAGAMMGGILTVSALLRKNMLGFLLREVPRPATPRQVASGLT